MITKMQWIYFGCQKNNKEDGLQMDSIWISDVIYPKNYPFTIHNCVESIVF